jgi:hypothetical protein
MDFVILLRGVMLGASVTTAVIVSVYVVARVASIAWYRSKADYDRGFVRNHLNGERDAKG